MPSLSIDNFWDVVFNKLCIITNIPVFFIFFTMELFGKSGIWVWNEDFEINYCINKLNVMTYISYNVISKLQHLLLLWLNFIYMLKECTDSLLDQLDQQLRITEDECKDYRYHNGLHYLWLHSETNFYNNNFWPANNVCWHKLVRNIIAVIAYQRWCLSIVVCLTL